MNLRKLFRKKSRDFKAGDKVTAFGNTGEIKSISHNGMFLVVSFENAPGSVIFNRDGRLMGWHKEPILRKL